ncbi:XAC2610-related protein [Flavobacterium collinsii]|uniref:Lipoprotein n=1 Tax=Flavobacterium collinsii TaxID=1114861 RepID=A0A9W4X9X5_9FLAO|nr:hypothetical protein [Flavobacterium collinsii]CAI2767133.1 conserved protein of unknown function [Flavobacterium collinsii]
MKTKLNIVAIVVIILLLFSCEQSNEKKKKSVVKKDSASTTLLQKEKERLEKRKKIEQQNKIDSLKFDQILTDAVKIATQNIYKNKFHNEYKVDTAIEVEISFDNHFTKKNPHLIIHRYGIDDVYIDIYSKVNNKFKKVVSHKEWSMTYRNDTIRDINGDGLKDFVLNWYGATGCCLKAFSNVYLLREDQKTFSNSFEFINPTFSPKEKIIRGVQYGHPGETEMYKYKWNGETIDTLEYVYYEKDKNDKKTGKLIISKNKPYNTNKKETVILSSMPNEYKIIEGYDWFTGKGYE